MSIVLMNKIKLAAGTGEITVSQVGHGDCAAFAAVRDGKIPGVTDPSKLFLVVDHSFNKKLDRAKGGAAQAKLEEILNDGIDFNDMHYDLYMAGSSQLRMAWCTLIAKAYRRTYEAWAACGIDIATNMVANKSMVYRALMLSTSIGWSSGTHLPEIGIDKVGVFTDIEIEVEAVVDEVSDNNVKRVKRRVTLKISDGIAILLVPDDTKDEDMMAFTFRAPWMKGLIIPIRRGHWVRAMKALGLNPVQKDFEGVERDLRDLQLITFKSVYKACKCRPLPELEAKGLSNWQAYVSEFKRLGHEFRICVADHDRLASVPYQQLQTLLLEGEDLKWVTDRSVERLSAYKDPHHASHLLPVHMGKVARIWPDVMADDFVREQVERAYMARRWQMLGGRVPAMMRYRFAAMDPVALMQGLCGAKVTGLIPAKHVVCSAYKPGKVLDVTRCPHLDNAHLLRRVFELQAFAGLYTGKTMFFSCKDVSMTAIQMDFDGDHVGVVDDETWVKLVRKSIGKTKNVPLYYEAKGSKPSERVTKDECVRMLRNLEPAPVGLYAFTLNKIYATGRYDSLDIAFATEGGNTCIDAAKYITGNSGDMTGHGAAQVLEAYKGVKNPLFVAYAKSSPFVEGSLAKRMENCRFYETSALDRYSTEIMRRTDAKLVMDDQESFQFRWKMLCAMTGTKLSIPEVGKVFEEEVFRHKKEEEAMGSALNEDLFEEFLSEEMQRIRGAVFAAGTSVGASLDEIVNAVVVTAYRAGSKAVATQMKRIMWMAFGDLLLKNVQANLGNFIEVMDATESGDEEPVCEDGFSYAGEECPDGFVDFGDCCG